MKSRNARMKNFFQESSIFFVRDNVDRRCRKIVLNFKKQYSSVGVGVSDKEGILFLSPASIPTHASLLIFPLFARRFLLSNPNKSTTMAPSSESGKAQA